MRCPETEMNKTEVAKTVRTLIEQVYPHFDKLKLKTSSDISFLDLNKLTNYETVKRLKPNILKIEIPYQPKKYELTLFQPTAKIIEYLCSALSTEPVTMYVCYAEVTYDFITRWPQKLATIINSHLVYKTFKKAYQCFDDETCYWGKRYDYKFIPVNYYDRKSKQLHKPCSHLEFRIYEKNNCEKHGLSVPSDLQSFDYVEFFEKNTKFFVMPKKYEIGHAAAVKDCVKITTNRGFEKYYDKKYKRLLGRVPYQTTQKYLQELPALKTIYLDQRKAENKAFTKKMQHAFLYKL